MATIPLGDFGNQTAGQTPGISVNAEAFGAGADNALIQFGGQVGEMANRKEAIKRREEEKKKQEMMSLFLTGALFGAVAVGGFVVLKWIFSKKEVVEVAETVAEAMTE